MLSNLKVGDEAKSCLRGWGRVYSVDSTSVTIYFKSSVDSFKYDGRCRPTDLLPEIVEVCKKKWEPKGGQKIIKGRGAILGPIIKEEREFFRHEGRAYPTYELAVKAHKMIRPYQRLVAWILENHPEYKGDYRWYVIYDDDFKKYYVSQNNYNKVLSGLPMPSKVADDLAEKLNSGEVEL